MRVLVACTGCKRQYDATGLAAGRKFHCSCGTTITVREPRPHDSAVVRCSSCSGPRRSEAPSCGFCGADFTLHEQDLLTICPSCMTRVGNRARYCHHCATPIHPEGSLGTPSEYVCPACDKRQLLTSRSLGEPAVPLLECPRCAGLWLGRETFRLLTESARRAAALPDPLEESTTASGPASLRSSAKKQPLYRRCPVCDELMNRKNFGGRSGVIIDRCRTDGIWFDAAELDRILSWIRSGGEALAERRQRVAEREAIRSRHLGALDRPGAPWNRSDEADGSQYAWLGELLGALFRS